MTRDVFPRRLETVRASPSLLLLESSRIRSQVRDLQRQLAAIDLQCLREMQELAEARTVAGQVQNLRGKSAKSIEFHLRAEAMKNLNKSKELADIRKAQLLDSAIWEGQQQLRYSRELAKSILDEERLIAPLDSLSKELKGYEQKSSNYFLNQRYRDPTRPRRLYGCLG